MSTAAEHWDAGHVLSWSGKWHIRHPVWSDSDQTEGIRALCSASGYMAVPKYHHELVKVANGEKDAPLCKLCERSAKKLEAS